MLALLLLATGCDIRGLFGGGDELRIRESGELIPSEAGPFPGQGTFPTSGAAPGFHADFVNGWDADIMDRWLDACIRPELDCERSELGGSESLF